MFGLDYFVVCPIENLQEKVFISTPANYTGCYWSKGDWATYLKLEKFDSKSYVFLKKDDFPTLLSLLEKAKTMLK